LIVDRTRWVVGVLAALLCVVPATGASADPNSDRNRVNAELAKTSAALEELTGRAKQAALDYESAVAALPAAQASLADARGRAVAADAAVRQAARDVTAAEAAAQAADADYQVAADQVTEARQVTGRYAAAAYKGGGMLLLNSVLRAGSPSEFAQRLGYLDHVAGDQQRAVRQLTAARQNSREQLNLAQDARRRAEQAKAAAAQALVASQTAVATAEAAAAHVTALIARREQAVAVANSQRAAVQAQYDQLKAESARIEAQLRAAAARAGKVPAAVAPGAGAYFLMPVVGHRSSGFGMRFHPLFHVWRMHTGLDLGAGMGAPIVAAGDGRVITAGWHGGYGNFTCIYHGMYQGKGLSTCYGHQSAILVRVGQWVHRGELIGRVGSTGTSTGPHLHFEVRLDGVPVNPIGWLPTCLC
jgi:murein DD-endopeptidase MepM/ murein hydrolase activator NlpD